jgi:hypothetical protein
LPKAAKQHKMMNKYGNIIIGDLKTAYKCFDAYANLGGKGVSITIHRVLPKNE